MATETMVLGRLRIRENWTLHRKGESVHFKRRPLRVLWHKILAALYLMSFLIIPAQGLEFRYKEKAGDVSVTNLPKSAFGEIMTVEPRNEIDLMFAYGYNEHQSSVTFTGSGSTTTIDGVFTLQTGAAATSSAEMASVKHLRYVPGRGAEFRFTAIFSPGVAGSTQVIGALDSGVSDGYGIGYNGTDFGVLRSSNGFHTWVASASFNVDRLDGTGPSKMTVNPAKFNVYSIEYQWLGAGQITYSIENPETGLFFPFHAVKFAGTETTPSAFNPYFQAVAKVQNHSNDTNITLRNQSFGAFIQGPISNGSVGHSSYTVQAGVGATAYPLITIRSVLTFNGVPSRVGTLPSVMSVANESTNRSARFSLVRDATLTGASFQPFLSPKGEANHSIIDVDDSATAMSGGDEVMTIFSGPGETTYVNLHDFHMTLYPGDTLTILGQMDSGSADLKAAIRWEERF